MRTSDYLAAVEQAEASASLNAAAEQAIQSINWGNGLIRNKNGIASKQHNYSMIFTYDENLRDRFRLDTFKHQITFQGELPFGTYEQRTDLDDVIVTKLLGYLGSMYGIDNERMTRRALEEAAADNSYDSMIEMLDSLVWDGEPRIETMFSILLGAEDNDYTREAARLLMRGAVCRAYTANGVQFDIMPVLVGEQGCRKTSFCRSLALSPEFFEDNLGELGKPDAARKLQGTLVVEMAELAAVKQTKQESVKAFITRINDSYRPLYKEETARYPRRCIFVGTTNDFKFLSESYWNRRYLPIECGKYKTRFNWTDQDATKNFFEQIWAEAITWYKCDPKAVLNSLAPNAAMIGAIKEQQDRFRIEDPWHEPIAEYLNENVGRKICAKELVSAALKLEPDKSNIKQIHELMRNEFPQWEFVEEPKRLGEWGPQSRWYIHRE